MLAAVLYGKEDVRIERVPIPDVGPGEVRVRIAAALTCGTDVKVYRRGYHAAMLRPPCGSDTNWPARLMRSARGRPDGRLGSELLRRILPPAAAASIAAETGRNSAKTCCL